jgi:hypothetical protein
MILKFEQQLSSKEAALIRNIYSKRRFLADLEDYLLFYKDFRSFLRTSSHMHYEYFLEKSVLKKLGSFTFPISDLENATPADYEQREKAITIDDLEFGFGENSLATGFSFFIREKKDNVPVFSLNQIYNDWMDEELDYERDEECENMLAKGLILDLATYFHNIFPLYQKIHKILLLNRKSLAKYIGGNLLNDFVLLFSLNSQSAAIPIMDFSKIPWKKTFFEKAATKPEPSWLKLGGCDHYYYKNRAEGEDNWGRTLNGIELWLNGANKLITIITPEDMQSSGYPYLVDPQSVVFDNFVKDNVNDWINQIISSTFFAENIYQKFKARMVLENI